MTIDHANPYRSPMTEIGIESVSRAIKRSIKLGTLKTLLGLIYVGLVFGVCSTMCSVMFEHVTGLVGTSPMGAPKDPAMLMLAVGVHSAVGFTGSLLATPFLLLADSKARLNVGLGFGIIAMLGTAAFVLLIPVTFGVLTIPALGPVASKVITLGCVFWLPTIIAAAAYGAWIKWWRTWVAQPDRQSIAD